MPELFPQRLGNCANHANTTQVQTQLPLSAPDKSAPTTQPLPSPPTSVPDRQPSNAYEDEESPCPPAEQLPSNESRHSSVDTSWPVSPLHYKNKRVALTQLGLSQLQVHYPTMCIQALIAGLKQPFCFCSVQPPDFSWGPHQGAEFRTLVDTAYEEVVHWRRNIFQVPSGSAGKAFVLELARLLQAYADSSSLECIAMKAITIAQVLLLQKPSRSSKSKDHAAHLQRRLELWREGDIPSLLEEGRCIQKYLRQGRKHPDSEKIARTFRDLMMKGNIHSALRYLS